MNTNLLSIGVDPGKTGAIVVIGQHNDERAFCFVMDNEEFEEDQGGADAIDRLRHRLHTRNTMGTSIIVAIERQQYIPKDGRRQGGKSTFSLGENYGRLRGLFEGYGLEVVTVPPQTWQGYVYGGRVVAGIDSKTRAIKRAEEIIPDLPLCPDKCRVPRHGRADAGLIALYGLGVLGRRGWAKGNEEARK